MISEIKYGGFTAQPSDYSCPDGDLALSLNLINEDGALQPLQSPKTLFHIDKGSSLYIHKAGNFSNYIGYIPAGRTIKWIGSEKNGSPDIFDSPKPITFGFDYGNIVSITSIGYILIVGTDTNTYYIRFNAVKNEYVYLGTRIPDLKLNFGLAITADSLVVSDVKFSTISNSDSETVTPDEEWTPLFYKSYNFDSSKGELRHNPDDTVTYISSSIYYFDSNLPLTLVPDLEYRFSWENKTHGRVADDKTTILKIYGRKNLESDREIILEINRQDLRAGSVKKVFNHEWVDICFKIATFNSYDNDVIFTNNTICEGDIIISKGIDYSGSNKELVDYAVEYTQDNYFALTANINKFINSKTKENKFIYPFFIRYGVRLFDGSYSFISDPCLMIPNWGYTPIVNYFKNEDVCRLVISSFVAAIRFKSHNTVPKEWEEIIHSIDVFISNPVWFYNQGKEYNTEKSLFEFYNSVSGSSYGKMIVNGYEGLLDTNYEKNNLAGYIKSYSASSYFVKVASVGEEEVMDKLRNTTSFFKIASLKIEDYNEAQSDFTDLKIEEGIISALTTQEPCPDNLLHYEGFKKPGLKTYNGRLHVFNSSVVLRAPATLDDCFNYISGDSGDIQVYVQLVTDEGPKVCMASGVGTGIGPWFFYPHNKAVKAFFVRNTGGRVRVAEVTLKTHEHLNGAYWLAASIDDTPVFDKDLSVLPSVDNTIQSFSSIYVSEANNPFVFKASMAVGVGAQRVVALASATQALSQGQFGQFPLYAFSSEGIWAISVAADGSYSAVQPIVRDETINIDSITQIDSAVLFAADRGIMMLAGSQTQCLSEYINSDSPFDISSLKGIDSLHSMIGHQADTCIPTAPFSSFLKSCRMLYDYPHQRIFIFSPSYTYAYVLSLKSMLWGLIHSNLRTSVNSYPEALVVDADGALLDFSASSGRYEKGLLLSRPLKLGAPDVLKSVSAVIQRGLFDRGDVASVLYGSRDLRHWHLIRSSQHHHLRGFSGSPFKYFRIALVCSLSAGESISGASVQFMPRYTNRLR